MKKDLYALLSGGKFVELSKGKRIYKKQLIAFGAYVDPNSPAESMILDQDLAERMVANFRRGLIRVATPTIHTVDSAKNAGEVVDLMVEPDGLYGLIEIRREEVAEDIENGLIFDVSVSFEWNFQDTRTGEYLGETLTHVALVNDPYIPKMKPFEAVKAVASAFSQAKLKPVMLSRSKGEAMLVENTKEFDVTVTLKEGDEDVEKVVKAGEGVEVPEDQVEAVKAQIEAAEAPKKESEEETQDEPEKSGSENKESSEEEGTDEIKEDADAGESTEESEDKSENESEDESEGDESSEQEEESEDEKEGEENLSREGKADLSKENAELSKKNAELSAKLADKEIEEDFAARLKAGTVAPAMKDAFVALSKEVRASVSLSKGSAIAEKFQAFLDSTPKIVSLSQEEGTSENSDENGEDKGDQAESENGKTSISLSSLTEEEDK